MSERTVFEIRIVLLCYFFLSTSVRKQKNKLEVKMPLLRFTIPFCRRIFVGVGHPSDRFYRPCTLTSTFQKYLSNSVYFSTDAVENNGCEHDENNPRWSGADFRLASDIEENIQTPALVVSLPNVRHNISAMIQLCGGDVDRWRPHVKTTKMPLIWSELLSMGVRNFKCATIREARLLAATAKNMGLSTDCDILVAFPLHGANLRALEILAGEERECTFSCLVEAPEDIAQIPATVGFYIDINPGMDRTGRSLDVLTDQMAAMVECLKILNLHSDEGGHGNRFRGLHFYDGHSSTTPCGKARREMLFPIYNELLTFTQKLEQAYGRPVDEIITSGTPSCTSALSFEKFRGRSFHHRVSPGTTVLHDGKTREENEDLDAVLRPAAAVMARVISHPNSGMQIHDKINS